MGRGGIILLRPHAHPLLFWYLDAKFLKSYCQFTLYISKSNSFQEVQINGTISTISKKPVMQKKKEKTLDSSHYMSQKQFRFNVYK